MNNSPQLILTADGFTLRPELSALAHEKAAKILRHEHPRVHLVRAHVKHEVQGGGNTRFTVRATAEHAGPDHVVHGFASEPGTALNTAFSKLERELSEAAASRKRAQRTDDVTRYTS